jgi:Zn-dependent protease with chaperone function
MMTFNGTFYDGGGQPPEPCYFYFDGKKILCQTESQKSYSIPVKEIKTWNTTSEIEIELKTGAFPFYTIRTTETSIYDYFSTKEFGSINVLTPVKDRTMNLVFLAVIGLIIAILAGFYFKGIPWISWKLAGFVPIEQEVAVGKALLEQLKAEEDIDTIASENLQQFGNALILDNQMSLKFFVVKSSVINAYAMPGGIIVVNSGLLEKMTDYSQLVALLGHEVSHVNGRHALRSLVRNATGSVIIALIMGDFSSSGLVLAGQFDKLTELSYSRDLEREADKLGFQLLKQNKVSANGMIELFNILKKEEKIAPPAILSTHPLTDDRVTSVQKWTKEDQWKAVKNAKLDSIFANFY